MLGSVPGDAMVPRCKPELAADHRQQDADADCGARDRRHRDRQGHPCLGARVEVVPKVVGQLGVSLDLADDRRTGNPGRLDLRPSASQQADGSADQHTRSEGHRDDDHVGRFTR